MGLFRKINKIAADRRRTEEALYAMALQEITAKDIRPGLWAKAFAESEGQEARAQAAYLKLRVQQMVDELAALDRAMHRFNKEWGDSESLVNANESTAPGTTSHAPSAENQSHSSKVTDSPSSDTTPVTDDAVNSLATSRSGPLAWVIAGSFLSLLALSPTCAFRGL